METPSLKFSGHESFHCRPFWLKKGFDYVKNGFSFNDKSRRMLVGQLPLLGTSIYPNTEEKMHGLAAVDV